MLHKALLILIYLLTAIGLTASGNSTVHIYTQTIHRTTHFALQLRKKHWKNLHSVCCTANIVVLIILSVCVTREKN